MPNPTLLAAALALLLAGPAAAQTTGTITGVVTDGSTGNPAVGATVTATSPALPAGKATVTDAAGAFTLADLPPGQYRLQASLEGYKPESRADLTLGENVTLRANLAIVPEAVRLEEVVVTGSRVRRKDLNTPAPVTVFSRAEVEASGKTSIGEFLQTMPEQGNAPNFQLNNGGITYGADGATRVNLRSLGVTRTLVLLNGRRVVNSGVGASSSVDLNTIPTAAVERIEVLKDGASAVYGSDAIAGVVNVITRKSFNSTEGSAQYGVSGHGDAQTFDAQVSTGKSNESGGILFSVGYYEQKSSWLRDRSWAAHALTWDYASQQAIPGGSFRTPQGTVGLPVGVGGAPTAECLANALCTYLVTTLDPTNWQNDAFIRDPTAPQGWRIMGDADTYNFAADNYLTIPSQRLQVFSAGDTRLGPARGFFEMSFVQNSTSQNAAPMPLNPGDYTLGDGATPISVSAQSMYNPFGVDLPFAGRRLVEFGNRSYAQKLETFRVVTGLDGTLSDAFGPLRGWAWDAALNYGRSGGAFTTTGAIRNSRIADAVGPSFLRNGTPVCGTDPDGIPGNADDVVIPGCVPIDLFGGPNNGSIDPAQIANLGFTGTSRAEDSLVSASVNANGEVFSLGPDRAVSLALGYEHRRQAGAQIADPIAASNDSADFNFKSTSGSFSADEAYAELSVPLLANVPGAHSLELSAALRYVNYDTFGSNTSYKVGARWAPVPDVTLRGTFSTAFRAPTIGELFLGQTETAPNATDPCNYPAGTPPTDPIVIQCAANGAPNPTGDNSNQVLTRQGGNPDLKAETAKIFTAGAVFTPRFDPNLSVTVDYYQVQVDNLVSIVGTPGIIDGCFPAANPDPVLADRPPNQAYCDLIHRASTSGRILFVSDVNQNIGTLKTAGLDAAARYQLPTRAGRFAVGVEGTFLAYYDRTQPGGGGTITVHGKGNRDLGVMPAFKGNLNGAWAYGSGSAGAIVRYVGSFKECSGPDGTSDGGICYASGGDSRQVGSNVVVDLRGGYVLQSAAGRTTASVGINNVFDQKPQYVYSAPLANSDPTIYDYLGRYFYVRLTQTY
jgi:iron complex outermembrane recepter protein